MKKMENEEKTEVRPISWTSLEESRKLVELGMPLDTADMWWAERFSSYREGYVLNHSEVPFYYVCLENPVSNNCSQDIIHGIQCWTLGALCNVLKKKVGKTNLSMDGETVTVSEPFVVNTDKTSVELVGRNHFCYPTLIENVFRALVYVLEKEKKKKK